MRGVLPMPCVAVIQWRKEPDAGWWRTIASNRNFSSNDYLGLSHHPQIIRAWKQGAEQFGVGSGGSGHVSGYSVAHQALEEELAEWLGYSRALLFISGFAANQAVIAAMMAKEDRIVADRLSHASLLEAASLSPSGSFAVFFITMSLIWRDCLLPPVRAATGGDRRRVQHGRR